MVMKEELKALHRNKSWTLFDVLQMPLLWDVDAFLKSKLKDDGTQVVGVDLL